VVYGKPVGECPYYVVRTLLRERRRESFLPALLEKVNRDVREAGSKCIAM
jgi:hypothetical protein